MIQTDRVIKDSRPDIVLVEKTNGKCLIIDIAVPVDRKGQRKKELPGESKKVYAFGGLWNKKYVTDIQN